jgi:hypothetical protein
LGGSEGFCVRCGRELKPDARFCVGCGHAISGADSPDPAQIGSKQAASVRWYQAAPTRTARAPDDVVPPTPVSEPTWPSKGSHQPTEISPRPEPPSPPSPPPVPSSDDFWRLPGRFSPSPDKAPYPPDLGVQRPADQPRFPGGAGLRRSARPVGRPRSRRPLMLLLAVLLSAGAAAAVWLVVARPSHPASTRTGTALASQASHGTAPTTATSPSASSAPAPSPAQISQQQAATNLAGLLAKSVTDHSSIVAAVNDVSDCGPTLSQDPQTFQNAAASREQLLSELASLPGDTALPAAMLQDLTGAWQASEAADQDFAKWAQDEVSSACTQNDQSDANYQAATGPDDLATADKKAFVSQWNPIASQYGLDTYQWNQL